MRTIQSHSLRRATEVSLPYRLQTTPYRLQTTYSPSWAVTPEANKKKLEDIIGRSKVIDKYNDLDVFLFKEGNDIDFYFVHEYGLIQYGVRVIHHKLTGKLSKSTCGQVSVVRNTVNKATVGLTTWIFNKLLYPKYHSIVSDKAPSDAGETFWGYRILEALHAGKTVSALEVDEMQNVLDVLDVLDIHKITSTRDLNKFYTEGKDLIGKYYRFLIE